MSSIGTEIVKEQARVRELKSRYDSIGPAGTFGATMIELALRRADEAISSGDVVKILQSYKELKNLE